MGGEGMNGLAAAIFAVMAVMIAGGFAVFFLIGRLIGRRLGLGPGKRLMAGLVLGLAGIGVGVLAVIATFYEGTWAPPPAIRLDVPPGFAHRQVILLEDPTASRVLVWRGVEAPFRGKSAVIAVPASGIVRVRDIGMIAGRGDIAVTWSDGAWAGGLSAGPAPPSLGARSYVALLRSGASAVPAEDLPFDPEALARYIRQREAGENGAAP